MTSEIQLDEETRAALLLFNERIAAAAAEERATKRIAKADRAKNEAAKRVRAVNEDLGASAESKAEAEAAYKAAVAELARVTENPEDPPARTPAHGSEPTEISADEENDSPAGAAAESE